MFCLIVRVFDCVSVFVCLFGCLMLSMVVCVLMYLYMFILLNANVCVHVAV